MAGGAGARVSQAGVGDSQPSPPSTPPPPRPARWEALVVARTGKLVPTSVRRPSASRCQARSKK